MLSQSTSSQYNMAGVRTEDSLRDYEGERTFFGMHSQMEGTRESVGQERTEGRGQGGQSMRYDRAGSPGVSARELSHNIQLNSNSKLIQPPGLQGGKVGAEIALPWGWCRGDSSGAFVSAAVPLAGRRVVVVLAWGNGGQMLLAPGRVLGMWVVHWALHSQALPPARVPHHCFRLASLLNQVIFPRCLYHTPGSAQGIRGSSWEAT